MQEKLLRIFSLKNVFKRICLLAILGKLMFLLVLVFGLSSQRRAFES